MASQRQEIKLVVKNMYAYLTALSTWSDLPLLLERTDVFIAKSSIVCINKDAI